MRLFPDWLFCATGTNSVICSREEDEEAAWVVRGPVARLGGCLQPGVCSAPTL